MLFSFGRQFYRSTLYLVSCVPIRYELFSSKSIRPNIITRINCADSMDSFQTHTHTHTHSLSHSLSLSLSLSLYLSIYLSISHYVPIGHRSWQDLLTVFGGPYRALNANYYWLTNTGVCIYKSHLENVTYDCVLTSTKLSSMNRTSSYDDLENRR